VRAVQRVFALFLVFALPLAQVTADLHAQAHARYDLAQVSGTGKCAPPLDHPSEKCLVFHAVSSALGGACALFEAPRFASPTPFSVALPLLQSTRVPFDSRAPPVAS
jgi:hypothetical protein